MTPNRALIYAVILIITGSMALLQFYYKPEAITDVIASGQPAFREAMTGKGEHLPATVSPKTECPGCPVIQKIALSPDKPTVSDNIVAELVLDRQISGVEFEYTWHVNDKLVEKVDRPVLPSGLFKKHDRVSVNVTPRMNSDKGRLAQSLALVIHDTPPALALKEGVTTAGDTIELQLVGTDVDGDKITYALEDPRLAGMSVEPTTGKIIWKPSKKEAGVYSFGASATDADGAKITKIFEFTIGGR